MPHDTFVNIACSSRSFVDKHYVYCRSAAELKYLQYCGAEQCVGSVIGWNEKLSPDLTSITLPFLSMLFVLNPWVPIRLLLYFESAGQKFIL